MSNAYWRSERTGNRVNLAEDVKKANEMVVEEILQIQLVEGEWILHRNTVLEYWWRTMAKMKENHKCARKNKRRYQKQAEAPLENWEFQSGVAINGVFYRQIS